MNESKTKLVREMLTLVDRMLAGTPDEQLYRHYERLRTNLLLQLPDNTPPATLERDGDCGVVLRGQVKRVAMMCKLLLDCDTNGGRLGYYAEQVRAAQYNSVGFTFRDNGSREEFFAAAQELL